MPVPLSRPHAAPRGSVRSTGGRSSRGVRAASSAARATWHSSEGLAAAASRRACVKTTAVLLASRASGDAPSARRSIRSSARCGTLKTRPLACARSTAGGWRRMAGSARRARRQGGRGGHSHERLSPSGLDTRRDRGVGRSQARSSVDASRAGNGRRDPARQKAPVLGVQHRRASRKLAPVRAEYHVFEVWGAGAH